MYQFMKSTLLMALCAILVYSCSSPQAKQENQESTSEENATEAPKTITLEKKWSTDSSMTTSESVIYYADEDVLFVSNIAGVPPTAKDGDGFISKISMTGEVITEKWIEGLNAPKGMGIVNGELYVTNIDEVVSINIAAAEISNRWPVEGAAFLNDITTDADGNLYISDSNTNKIHMISEGTVSTWLSDSTMGGPNGLLHQGEKMMLATFGSGKFYSINTSDKSLSLVNGDTPGGDGVVPVGDDYIVSNWNGEVFYVTAAGENTKILDTKEMGSNAADIEYIAEKNLLLVPTFFGNQVVAYEVKM